MTHEELHQLRAERWEQWLAAAREDGSPAAALVRHAGLAPWQPLPGIALGSIHSLAGDETQSGRLRDELEAMLAAQELFELQLWPAAVYASRELLPLIFIWAGQHPSAKSNRVSPLAAQIETELMRHDVLSTAELRQKLGMGRTSEAAIEKACYALAQTMRVFRIGNSQGRARWQTLSRAWPDLKTEITGVARATALSELLLPIFEQWRAATEEELEKLLLPVAPAHVLRSVLNGLVLGKRLRPTSIAGMPGWEWVEIKV